MNGERYWQRTRFATRINALWTDWGADWYERVAPSMTLSAPSAASFGTAVTGTDHFTSISIGVTTTTPAKYRLMATDRDDAWGMERDTGGAWIPDWVDSGSDPKPWAAGVSGHVGVTVRDATGGRDPKWGTAYTPGAPFAESNVLNNDYAGLDETVPTELHRRTTASAGTDTVLMTMRANAAASQASGDYEGHLLISAVPIP